MPVFSTDLLRAKQKAEYFLRAICRHNQAYEFLNGRNHLLCWCSNPKAPQSVYSHFEHVIQKVEVVLLSNGLLRFPGNSSFVDLTPPQSVDAKRRRSAASIEVSKVQGSRELQFGAGPSTSNEHLNPHPAQESAGLTEKEQTKQWKSWIDDLWGQLEGCTDRKLCLLHTLALKQYDAEQVAGVNLHVPEDLGLRLNTARQCLISMMYRLQNSGFAEDHAFALRRAIIESYFSHDSTYNHRLLLWYLEEIGRLSELMHRVKAVMSGNVEVGAGVPLPKNVVFLGDYGEQQTHVQQTYPSTPSGYGACYPSSGCGPQMSPYVQHQLPPGVPHNGPAYFDSVTTLPPPNRQPEQSPSGSRTSQTSDQHQAKVTKDVLVIAAVVIGFTTGNIGPKNLERQGHGGSC
ncbi:hypothetical protein AAVH_21460 [Aphelenchoides avenae]|nr:hypothetical protein AAVH_21460 [Aphelenchus avenae]